MMTVFVCCRNAKSTFVIKNFCWIFYSDPTQKPDCVEMRFNTFSVSTLSLFLFLCRSSFLVFVETSFFIFCATEMLFRRVCHWLVPLSTCFFVSKKFFLQFHWQVLLVRTQSYKVNFTASFHPILISNILIGQSKKCTPIRVL